MSVIKKLKSITWWTIAHLPFHIRYFVKFRIFKGHWPHFIKKDYSDYIFWDCFYGRFDKVAYLADKVEVRKYVASKGLAEILIPMISCWDNAMKIDFDSLPNQFAIKCNHSCGMNIIVNDKSSLDIESTRKKLDAWMHVKHPEFNERHYYRIKPQILCEELIPCNADGYFPTDYKIHCAHGKPIFIQCCIERDSADAGRRIIYDCNWNKLPYVLNDEHFTEIEVKRPKFLSRMLEVASILSEDLDYARIDLYETDKGVLFGEITLTPMGGWLSYFTQEALDVMGIAIKEGKKGKQ